MRELSLHILDLVENSIRAGAHVVNVLVDEDDAADVIRITIGDDGAGIQGDAERAVDPFYTTKPGKRTGLGLSLFRSQTVETGGELLLGRSPLGGLEVRASLGRTHIDRLPLGDLASTVSTIAASAPEIDLRIELRSGGRAVRLSSAELASEVASTIAVAQRMGDMIRQGMSDLRIDTSYELRREERSMATSSAPSACAERATDRELEQRLGKVLAEYKGKAGALIPVLQIAQGIYGHLPDTVLKRIAASLGKSFSEVAGVVGFYSFFSRVPRGKHLVRVCLGTACYVRGGKNVLEALKQELHVDVGGTTEDGQFSLEVARCFGACGLAPTIMIDDDVIQRVKPARVRAILDVYRDGGAKPGGNGKHKAPKAAAAATPRAPGRAKARVATKRGAKRGARG